ncbi:MAG: DUF2442 domain-containing protein [Candidatus Competibacteraceae bacterium]
MVASNEYEQANDRAHALRDSCHKAVAARYDRRIGRVVVSLSTGLEIAFPPRLAQELENAKPADMSVIEISPSGFGLHFPTLDADLYLPALLDGMLGSRRWMASRMGEQGGKVRSTAKAAASRENGKQGGRPRKPAVMPADPL